MPQPQKKVVLYFIGTVLEQRQLPSFYEVRGKTYPEPNEDGNIVPLKLGDTITVNEGDVQPLLRKSTTYVKGQGEITSFTTRADIAAAVVANAKRGLLTPIPENPTLADLMKIAPTDEVKRQVSEALTVEDLQRMLEEKGVHIGKTEQAVASAPVVDEKSTKATKSKEG